MNKKLMSIIFGLVLLASAFAIAESFDRSNARVQDYIIWGRIKIDDEPIQFLEVTIQNKRTSYSTTFETNNKGEYVFSLGNFLVLNSWERPYQCGDEIFVEACKGNVDCRITIRICEDTPFEGGFRIDFNIDEEFRPEKECNVDSDCKDNEICTRSICVEREVVQEYVCPDGIVVTDIDDCEFETEDKIYTCPDGTRVANPSLCGIGREGPVYVCWDRSVVADWNDCPIKPSDELSLVWKILISLVAVVLAAFGFGKGFIGLTKYYAKKGLLLIAEGKRKNNKKMIAEGEKYLTRAIKMSKTALERAKAGVYDKHKRR